ncbi:MAG: hypothetical protein CMF39_05870 [Legionellaceae bacterium]|nr:hypothetical protein [Legionellaceae bacterium]
MKKVSLLVLSGALLMGSAMAASSQTVAYFRTRSASSANSAALSSYQNGVCSGTVNPCVFPYPVPAPGPRQGSGSQNNPNLPSCARTLSCAPAPQGL